MKTLGIIGGIGPDATIDYYKLLTSGYRKRVNDGSYPHVLVNSMNLSLMVALLTGQHYDALVETLVEYLGQLARAGAEVALLAANAPHVVFDRLVPESPLPLVSIVEATCAHAQARGLKRVGLFGTEFTMKAGFYQETFRRAGIEVAVPEAGDQEYIHEKYMSELLRGDFRVATRTGLLAIAHAMKEREGIEGLILGGTELPLLLRDSDAGLGLRYLDTTRIHVAAALDAMLGAAAQAGV